MQERIQSGKRFLSEFQVPKGFEMVTTTLFYINLLITYLLPLSPLHRFSPPNLLTLGVWRYGRRSMWPLRRMAWTTLHRPQWGGRVQRWANPDHPIHHITAHHITSQYITPFHTVLMKSFHVNSPSLMLMMMMLMICSGGLGPADYNLREVKQWLAGRYGMRGEDIQVGFIVVDILWTNRWIHRCHLSPYAPY